MKGSDTVVERCTMSAVPQHTQGSARASPGAIRRGRIGQATHSAVEHVQYNKVRAVEHVQYNNTV